MGLGDSAEVTGGLDLKVGAEASADAEVRADRIVGNVEAGATLGVGFDVSVDVSISPSGILDDAGDFYNEFRGLFSD